MGSSVVGAFEGPPASELPGIVNGIRVVTRSPGIVVAVGPLQLFSTGLWMNVTVRFGPGAEHRAAEAQDELLRLLQHSRERGEHRLAFGIQYDDGSARSNLDGPRSVDEAFEQAREPAKAGLPLAEPEPHLDCQGGSGRGPMWILAYWVWPPPDGGMSVFASWPRQGVPAGEVSFASAEFRAAQDLIQRLWS